MQTFPAHFFMWHWMHAWSPRLIRLPKLSLKGQKMAKDCRNDRALVVVIVLFFFLILDVIPVAHGSVVVTLGDLRLSGSLNCTIQKSPLLHLVRGNITISCNGTTTNSATSSLVEFGAEANSFARIETLLAAGLISVLLNTHL